MCWCRPGLRTICCGSETCHVAARRQHHDTFGRVGLSPNEPCPWCVSPSGVIMPALETKLCVTCAGTGRVPVEDKQ